MKLKKKIDILFKDLDLININYFNFLNNCMLMLYRKGKDILSIFEIIDGLNKQMFKCENIHLFMILFLILNEVEITKNLDLNIEYNVNIKLLEKK